MEKNNREEILQEEIDVERERIKKDEKIIKTGFLVSSIILIVVICIVTILFFRSTNQQESSEVVTAPAEIIDSSPTPTLIRVKTESNVSIQPVEESSSYPKEYFVSFGSGTGKSTDWSDVGGLQASVDLTSYGKVKEIRFEASVQDPGENQTISVRVYDKTSKHPVWNSEVVKNAGADSYMVSAPIIYDSGRKTYTVQMETQLGSTVTIGEARLHIYLE